MTAAVCATLQLDEPTATSHPVFDVHAGWGKRSKTPAEIVAEIRRERETALSRKLAGMAHSNETSLGNPMPGASVARR